MTETDHATGRRASGAGWESPGTFCRLEADTTLKENPHARQARWGWGNFDPDNGSLRDHGISKILALEMSGLPSGPMGAVEGSRASWPVLKPFTSMTLCGG